MFAFLSVSSRPHPWLAAAFLLALAACGSRTEQAPDAGLRAEASDPRAVGFYEARQWRAAWNREREAALVSAIAGAEQHGLNGRAFIEPVERAGSPAAREIALTMAALSYADALARGHTEPTGRHAVSGVPRPDPDLRAGLERALAGGDLAAWFAALAPQDEEYRALASAYAEANRRLAATTGRPAPALSDRVRTLAVNLERRRWLDRAPPATRIDVNTAAATLTYWRDGAPADRRRAIVGEPGNETPQLASPLYRLVAYPTWTVPRSIQEEEIEPQGEAYMARENMEWRDGWIVQRSGPDNALGLVKFDMRNDRAIYLHDTPAKARFAGADRHASHGCVRVDDALGFAEMIAADAGVLAPWREALATREESFVPLPRPIPVRLLYHTAFLTDGEVSIAPDSYGWDEDVAEALGLPARPRPTPARRARDPRT